MGNYTLEHVLNRTGSRQHTVTFKVRGSCLTLLILETCEADREWSGEVGAMSAKTCLEVAAELRDWVRNPTFNSRGTRINFREDYDVENYGIAYKIKSADDYTAEPHSGIDRITLKVSNDRDAIALADEFDRVHGYLTSDS